MKKRRKYREQDPPFCIQVEMTEGCNLRCGFCGLQGIRAEKEKNYKLADPVMFYELFSHLQYLHDTAGWNPRIEFAMHGEPSMHPDFVRLVDIAREQCHSLQLMMTSNGAGFLRKPGPVANLRAIFDAGLNVLALDDYDGVGIVPKIREAVRAEIMVGDFDIRGLRIYDYPDEPEGNPHRRHSLSRRMLSFVADITRAKGGTHATLTNHAGCGSAPLDKPLQERCAKPFREMGVRWDGNISMCCNDWRGHYKCGNVRETPIEEIWNGPGFGAAREMLYVGGRGNIVPCNVCDYRTYRNGLLPDKMGKLNLPKPDSQTLSDIDASVAGAPYAVPALRPWEKEGQISGMTQAGKSKKDQLSGK